MSDESELSGPWWQLPPLRSVLAAGIISGAAYALRKLDIAGNDLELAAYVVSNG